MSHSFRRLWRQPDVSFHFITLMCVAFLLALGLPGCGAEKAGYTCGTGTEVVSGECVAIQTADTTDTTPDEEEPAPDHPSV